MLFFLCFAVCFFLASSQSFDRFKFIDQHPQRQTYLFRGNDIVSNGTVDYDWLVNGIKYAANASALPNFPDKFYIVDFCLLSVELTDWITEEDFFSSNSSLGKFVHNPIIGSISNPLWFPESVRKVMAEDTSGFDNLSGTMKDLVNLLYASYPLPTVIYIHCEAGKDRTGEVSGSYYISQQNVTFNQALYYDDHCVEGSRDIETASMWAFEWYCWYLKWNGDASYADLDCTPNLNYVGHC